MLVLALPRDPSPAYPGVAAPPTPDPSQARVARAFGTPVPRGGPAALGTPVPLPSPVPQPIRRPLPDEEPRASAYVGSIQGVLRELEFHSPALDAELRYFIYLPPDYGTAGRRYPDEVPASLDAHIKIVHGDAILADSSDGEVAMCDRFEGWVRMHYAAQGT